MKSKNHTSLTFAQLNLLRCLPFCAVELMMSALKKNGGREKMDPPLELEKSVDPDSVLRKEWSATEYFMRWRVDLCAAFPALYFGLVTFFILAPLTGTVFGILSGLCVACLVGWVFLLCLATKRSLRGTVKCKKRVGVAMLLFTVTFGVAGYFYFLPSQPSITNVSFVSASTYSTGSDISVSFRLDLTVFNPNIFELKIDYAKAVAFYKGVELGTANTQVGLVIASEGSTVVPVSIFLSPSTFNRAAVTALASECIMASLRGSAQPPIVVDSVAYLNVLNQAVCFTIPRVIIQRACPFGSGNQAANGTITTVAGGGFGSC
jgi:hypothetical protein